MVRTLVVVAMLLAAASARADKLAPEDLARKNENGYFTGLPLAAYSTDLGFGAGARAYYFFNGTRDDARFASSPYLYRVFLQAFASTRGIQFHWLDLDAPKIMGSPFRLRAELIYARNINSNYFGLGSKSLQPLTFPGTSLGYGSYSDYLADQQRIYNGTTWGKYNQYDIQRPILWTSLERLFLDDHLRVLAGVGVSYAKIHDYTGSQVDATDAAGNATTATMGTTRLAADCAAGILVGCNGGRDNGFRLAVSYDTRDFEPDPNRGVFVDAEVDTSTAVIGSNYDYLRALVAARGYWSPIPDTADLVLAGRVAMVAQTNGAPFFSMDTFPFTEDPRQGLGGHRTLRGFRQDRFVGSVMTVANAELRWTFAHACLLKQKFAFFLVPFFDTARPYDSLGELTFRGWKRSYGAAFRVSWNLATIATVDYGISSEDTGFYVNFNHMF